MVDMKTQVSRHFDSGIFNSTVAVSLQAYEDDVLYCSDFCNGFKIFIAFVCT